MKNTLTWTEVLVLSKLGLKEKDIFPPIRKNAKGDLDAVSYIWVKWYIDNDWEQEVLSIAIYEGSNKIAFFIYNKVHGVKRHLRSVEFKALLSNLKEYSAESIDEI